MGVVDQKGDRSNVVLVGMPGAGKSTVGVLLAKATGRGFVDTDVLIQVREGMTLQEIVETRGYLSLRESEEAVLLDLRCERHVVATGGSAVYSRPGMAKLKREGVVVFLDVDLAILRQRVLDFGSRGIACRPGQSLSGLYEERAPLYRAIADVRVACGSLPQDEVVQAILAGWSGA